MTKKIEVKSGKSKPGEKTEAAPQATHATYAANPAKITRSARAGDEDPAFALYGEGLQALDRKDWAKGIELLQKVIEVSDLADLTARARQYLAAAEKRVAANAATAANSANPAGDSGETAEGDDPYLHALIEKNRGNFKTALDLSRKGGRDKKDERFAYLVASIHAAESRTEEAAQALSQAVELNAKNRIHAFHDADFAELKKNRDYRHLFGLS
jgi:tetratricopeptide (TPR) repeat protein